MALLAPNVFGIKILLDVSQTAAALPVFKSIMNNNTANLEISNMHYFLNKLKDKTDS